MKHTHIVFVLALIIAFPAVSLANTCSLATTTVVSDTSVSVEGGDNAVLAWISPLWTTIDGASWIWKTHFVTDPNNNEYATFTKSFVIPGTSVGSSILTITADDYFAVNMNGIDIISEFNDGNFFTPKTYDVTASIHSGTNTISVAAVNAKYFYGGTGTIENNPGAIIFSLAATSQTCTNTDGGSSGGSAPQTGGGFIGSNGGGGSGGSAPQVASDFIGGVGGDNDSDFSGKGVVFAATNGAEGIDEVLGDSTSTATSAPEISNNSFAASALTGLDGFIGDWKCLLIALALMLILYIIGESILKDSREHMKRIAFFTVGTLVIILALYLIGDTCSIIPLIVMDIILSIAVYFELV